MKRIMGTETEYGIVGGQAGEVVRAHHSLAKEHTNLGETNTSIVPGMKDIGGHVGGDYGVDEFLSSRPSLGRRMMRKLHLTGYTVDTPDQTLPNGARFYVDMGHPEYCTPESSNPRNLVIADKAGERIVANAAKKVSGTTIYKNNSDGQGNSFGCHENYLVQRVTSEDFEKKLTSAVIPFFVTRQIFTGSGKIGIEEPVHFASSWGGYGSHLYNSYGFSPTPVKPVSAYSKRKEKLLSELDNIEVYLGQFPEFGDVLKNLKLSFNKAETLGEPAIYQLSQRADFFEEIIGLSTTSNRPLMNTRDEPHADREKYMRLHVINGDANLCEAATYLKVGSTSLVLDLIESGLAPSIFLKDPVRAFKKISQDQGRNWAVPLSSEGIARATDIQRAYLEAAKKNYAGRDAETDAVLSRWGATLDALVTDPMQLVGQVDWVTKLHLLNHLSQKNGAPFTSELIRNAALQYHDISSGKGLFRFMENKGLVERLVSEEEISLGMVQPPRDTRAYLRGQVVRLPYVSSVDWGGFTLKVGKKSYDINLSEPFGGTEEQLGELFTKEVRPAELLEKLKSTPGISVRKKAFYIPKKTAILPLGETFKVTPSPSISPAWEANFPGAIIQDDFPFQHNQAEGGNTDGAE